MGIAVGCGGVRADMSDMLTSVLWALGVAAIWLLLSGLAMAAYRICCRLRYGYWP